MTSKILDPARTTKVLAFAAAGLLCASAPALQHVSHQRALETSLAHAGTSRTDASANTAVGEVFEPSGNGYWAIYSDGTVEPAPPAQSYGDPASQRLARPIEGGVATPDGHGYWLVASDGGIFSYGDARFYGSAGNIHLNRPIVGMAATPDGHGYWLVASDGGIFSYGDAGFAGSGAGVLPTRGQRAVGVTGAGQGGYWIETSSGTPLAMDAPLSAQSPAQPAGGRAVQSSQLAVNQVPSRSIPPSSSFEVACYGGAATTASCDHAALADINSARAQEGYGPLPLPADYGSLPLQAQLVATANAERVSRGLPAFPEDGRLDAMAEAGAQRETDPTGPSGFGWSSNWAVNYPSALAADYVWMYDDGLNSPNIDCGPSRTSGCWGHRLNILSPWAGRAGAGVYDDNGSLSLTQLFAEDYH